jgi:hypothetical protein
MAKIKHDFTHCMGYHRSIRGGVEPLDFDPTEPWARAKIMTRHFSTFSMERMAEGAAILQDRERLAAAIPYLFR